MTDLFASDQLTPRKATQGVEHEYRNAQAYHVDGNLTRPGIRLKDGVPIASQVVAGARHVVVAKRPPINRDQKLSCDILSSLDSDLILHSPPTEDVSDVLQKKSSCMEIEKSMYEDPLLAAELDISFLFWPVAKNFLQWCFNIRAGTRNTGPGDCAPIDFNQVNLLLELSVHMVEKNFSLFFKCISEDGNRSLIRFWPPISSIGIQQFTFAGIVISSLMEGMAPSERTKREGSNRSYMLICLAPLLNRCHCQSSHDAPLRSYGKRSKPRD
ncbi:uncharacterized protein BDR25DRAFT_362579 [Lindgomyces ingoldianus]|uniref:Uncharacterized protein n=1 Tax=Lindgomyces ingoldianus TaxID=673940 RepID=A0ACB6Q9L9_9PLEO|nr:uncharacterized protein BDR25DRAFT_362579 [Lindgomyces ingoldianus]KAF2463575.1 hypothetical protein BDR25DRAFT_362579 [Lindgomyces ingoldianus]